MKRPALFCFLCMLLSPATAPAVLDTNSNGLSDLWERQHNDDELFDETFNPWDDPDHDRWTNAEEAAAGTDPFDPNPPDGLVRPTTTHTPAVYGEPDGQGNPTLVSPEIVTVSWPTTAGKQYTLLVSTDLTAQNWLPVEAPFIATGTTVQFHFQTDTTERLFWRVAVCDTDSDGDGLSDAEEAKVGTNPVLLDSDGDGLPDAWESEYGLDPLDDGSLLASNGPNGDPDGDGATNLMEFSTNSSPLDALSFYPFFISVEKSALGECVLLDQESGLYAGDYQWIASNTGYAEEDAEKITPAYLDGVLSGFPFPLSPTEAASGGWQVNTGVEYLVESDFLYQDGGDVSETPFLHTAGSIQRRRFWLKAPPSQSSQRFQYLRVVEERKESLDDLGSGLFEVAEASDETFEIPPFNQISSSVDLKTQTPFDPDTYYKTREYLVPMSFELIHIEKERDAEGNEITTTINPGKDVLLRDEIAELKISIPTIHGHDWSLNIDIEPETMKTQSMGTRGQVQTYDFGVVANGNTTSLSKGADGATQAGPYDLDLQHAEGGEKTIRIVINKEGYFRVVLKSSDNKINISSQEFTVAKRIRKYASLPSSIGHDLDRHDQEIIAAAEHWEGVYMHAVDTVDRIKAIGMAESELGLTDENDIMTIGNAGDHVLDTFRNVPPYDKFPSAGLALREVVIANNSTKMLSYPNADEQPPGVAILYGTCWLYQKASRIAVNPNYDPGNPKQPYYIPGAWRDWDDATERYNGGGVPNYLERIHRSLYEGSHPTIPNLFIWPVLTNDIARGNGD
ncbi:MAG: hypothetical protein KDN05_02915 [Verrucomicrobiae bacterium]|nr:hypothetical protein [Verrucomicrobiae bacterium]